MAPQVGLVFQHRRVLDEMYRPAAYVVTRISKGVVWFKQPGERKAKECCAVEDWPSVFGGEPRPTVEESAFDALERRFVGAR